MSTDTNTPPELLRELAETVFWCRERLVLNHHPRTGLRSPELRPPLEMKSGYGEEDAMWVEPELVRFVVRRRTALLRQSRLEGRIDPLSAGGGRLLVSAPNYTNHNALTSDLTDGFLDENDVPPWDAWVGCIEGREERKLPFPRRFWPPTLDSTLSGNAPDRSLLISWIPDAFIPAVDEAIDAECIGMLSWADLSSIPGGGGPDFARIVPEWLRELGRRLYTARAFENS
jgi:hypothetical protein